MKTKISLILASLLTAAAFAPLSGATPSASAYYGEADLKAGTYGPDISVGVKSYSKNDLKEDAFEIKANKDYRIKDRDGKLIATVPAAKTTKVKYISDKMLRIYNSIPEATSKEIVYFDAADGSNTGLIFDINKPGSSFDHYRGRIKLDVWDDGGKIWVINILPLELYVWGTGEITGTGDGDYNKVMATAIRTYGYWKIKFSTKYAPQGFKVDATSGSQLYYGYDWEKDHTRIRDAAKATQGKIVMYGKEIALTPYSSWTDGKTRRYEDGHWGGTCEKATGTASKVYPWMDSVKDSHGKHPTKSTCTLAKEGNHMVGISAHGALDLAGKHSWAWDKILNYYFDGIKLYKAY